MIYTVTFSPAIDYAVYMEGLKQGETNRTKKETYSFGGKGINVSIVLSRLGIASRMLGFVSGFTGEALENGLKAQGLDTDFIHLDEGITRINIKIKAEQETEINGQGPKIPEEKLEMLLKKLDCLKEGDIVVVSGNIPDTLPKRIYEIMMQRLEGRGIRFAADATGELLKNVLKYRPFFVKPNRRELEELVGTKIQTEEALQKGAKQLQDWGACNVLVSLGEDGAYLLCEDGNDYRIGAVRGTVKNTVGAGDSMAAGFLAGFLEKGDYEYALRLGTAAGSATACSEGLAEKEEIWSFFSKL